MWIGLAAAAAAAPPQMHGCLPLTGCFDFFFLACTKTLERHLGGLRLLQPAAAGVCAQGSLPAARAASQTM